jgi:hypothetical protein
MPRRLLPLLLSILIPACSGQEERTGSERRFSTVVREGVSWLVTPAGEPFFSLGVCVVNQGTGRAEYDPARRSYAAWRHHAGATAWADATLARLGAWGFTTIGGWCDSGALLSSPSMDFPLTPVLAAGMEAGVPWFDLWDPSVLARVEALVREKVVAVRHYPGILGYYTDNEMGWWNGALFKMTLEHPAGSGQRQRLVKLLREAYGGDWTALLRDFDGEGVDGFDGLERTGVLYLRPGGDGIRAVRRFLELVADRYYEVLSGLVRRHDPGALVLGDRYQSFYYPEVARAAARHVDVVSTNLNAHWNDGTFARFYLDTLHELCGRPIIVSEFYMAASENRSGNPNDRGFFPVVRTQTERAEGCRTTLTALAGLPYVVGADWFQYYDEPPGGRFDGENYDFGLVDIDDRPYEELVSVTANFDGRSIHARPSSRRKDAREGIPPAPADPYAGFEPYLALRHWDRERGFLPAASRAPMADLYLAWSPDAIYIGLFTLDAIEGAYYRDGKVPEADRMEWTVEIDGLREPIRVRLGAGLPVTGAPQGVTAVCLSGVKLNVRTISILGVPARLLGREKLSAGAAVRLASTLTTHARAYRVEWRGGAPGAPAGPGLTLLGQ